MRRDEARNASLVFFFFNDAATTEIYTLSLHDALPIFADDLAAALAEQAAGVRFSRDEEPDSDDLYIPPINNPDQPAKVSGLLDRLPSHARVLTGGAAADGPGYFYAPTGVTGVRQDDEIARSEVFGPIITGQTFAKEAGALELAKDPPYGLASRVCTTDHARALRMSRALEFGCV